MKRDQTCPLTTVSLIMHVKMFNVCKQNLKNGYLSKLVGRKQRKFKNVEDCIQGRKNNCSKAARESQTYKANMNLGLNRMLPNKVNHWTLSLETTVVRLDFKRSGGSTVV